MRRWCSLLLGVGMVLSVLGVAPATAAPKKRLPDLVVPAVQVSPAQVTAGGVLTVRDTTRNKGRRPARRSVTRYLLSKNKKLDSSDVRLGQRRVKRLKARQRHVSKKRQVRVPATTKPGRYWLLVCADARRQVREADERNNCRVAKGKRIRVTRSPKGTTPPEDPFRILDVTARVQVEWRRWNERSQDGATTDDDQRATFDLRTTGELQVHGGKPLYLRLHVQDGRAQGIRTYRFQNDCLLRTGSLRSGWETIDPAANQGKYFFIAFPHPVQQQSAAMGGVVHTFTGGSSRTVDCGTTYEGPFTLKADAGHDGTAPTTITASDDLRRVTYTFRNDIQESPAVRLGESGTVTIDLTLPD